MEKSKFDNTRGSEVLENATGEARRQMVTDISRMYQGGFLSPDDYKFIMNTTDLQSLVNMIKECYRQVGIDYSYDKTDLNGNAYMYEGERISQSDAIKLMADYARNRVLARE